ncbi:MAG: hypothetical protein WAL71_08525 [Terriglobales bacterium]|jgi:hypothetical protein
MHYRQKPGAWTGLFVLNVVIVLALLVVPETALAKNEPKAYPESGKVISTGLNEHTKSHPKTGPNGSMGGGNYSVYSHTYKVETDSRIYELDCGKVPTFGFHSTGKGCGGEKELEIGDVIKFRIEKDSFYLPKADGSEQKLRILNQELKPDAKPDEAKPAEAKEPDAKQ